MRSILRILAVVAAIALVTPASAFAQDDYKIEITPYIGYTFSEGVPVNPVDTNNGTVDRVSPVSSLGYGFQFDVLASENFSIGFNFSQQDSELEGKFGSGGGKEVFTDMAVRNYHGIFTYNWGDSDEPMRPFFFGGVGATSYSPSDIEGYSFDSMSKFSSTWGGGVKLFPSDNIGIRLQARWTPTYINSSEGGYWCSGWYPWGGCWYVADPNYSNQFDMSAGVIFRF